jgi:3-methyladenine DNA glycosylase AlkD
MAYIVLPGEKEVTYEVEHMTSYKEWMRVSDKMNSAFVAFKKLDKYKEEYPYDEFRVIQRTESIDFVMREEGGEEHD